VPSSVHSVGLCSSPGFFFCKCVGCAPCSVVFLHSHSAYSAFRAHLYLTFLLTSSFWLV
jgi:hypothetical protein